MGSSRSSISMLWFAAMALGSLACRGRDRKEGLSSAAPAMSSASSLPPVSPAQGLDEPLAADAPMPGPAREGHTRGPAAVVENQRCVGCHPQQAAEWVGSPHQRASVNPAFRAALAIEPLPFCRGCHAPEAEPARDPTQGALRDLGVGCVSCHVPVTNEQTVLAPLRSARGGTDATSPPHPVRRSAAFSGDGACAGCHEFAFPPSPGRWALALAEEDDAHLMQTTVREHRRSQGSAKTCASCHMTGASSHGFRQTRDAAFLRQSVVISASRDGDAVTVTLRQATPGHRLPTGDLFRRLEVGAELRRGNGAVVARATRHLARHFVVAPLRGNRTLTGDDRLGDGPTTVTLSLAGAAEGVERGVNNDKMVVFFWVDYQRVATVGLGVDPDAAAVESAVRLREGALP